MTQISERLLARLACPRDHEPVAQRSPFIVECPKGHKYPVVAGIPVFLLDDTEQTIDLARASVAAARRLTEARSQPEVGELFVETLGISASEREEVRTLADRGDSSIDPVASVLVGATNGYAYRGMIGKLQSYPIPEIRLAPVTGRSLLDVGCSWGRWSVSAARRGYAVVGIDPSLGAVMAARRIALQLGHDNDYVCADARFLPFRTATFDNVFSYSVVQHFSKAAAGLAIAESARVLAPTGQCLVQMPNARGLRSLYHRARRGFSEGSGFQVRYWTICELEEVFGRYFSHVETSVHCFFGLGLEASDIRIVSGLARRLIEASEGLRKASTRVASLKRIADSLYVSAAK